MSLFDDVFKSGGSIEAARREQLERIQVEKMRGLEQRHIDQMTQSTLQNSALNTYGTGLGAQMGSTQQAYNQAMQQKMANQAVKPLPRFDPNKSEAYLIPLSQAVTMWQVKHGDNWYDAHELKTPMSADFYSDVFGRLKKAELFESIDGWYRLKENVENLLANH